MNTNTVNTNTVHVDPTDDLDADPNGDLVGEFEHRVLCPDGACVGIIGPAGCCKECGTLHVPPSEGGHDVSDEPAFDGASCTEFDDSDDSGEFGFGDEAQPDLDSRQLCSDGACVGVIGRDLRCKVCGLPYADNAPLAS